MAEKINTEKFKEYLKGEKPVVCDFYADRCAPCRMLAPVVEEVAKDFADKAVFVKVNVDEEMELAAKYGIMAIPFIAVFKNGEMSAKTMGYMSKSEFTGFVSENL